jgi:hypothetical protein
LILGLPPEKLTAPNVVWVWKEQIAASGVRPDQGGDTEAAIYLNTAKDTLIKWIEGVDPLQPTGIPRRPLPGNGSGPVALPLPEFEDTQEP